MPECKMRDVHGIVPVVLTPFTSANQIDWDGYAQLLDWYLDHKVDALFAVCQSSEMYFLTLEERVALSRFTVEHVHGRVPVVTSGHINANVVEAAVELNQLADTGADAIVLVTNRLAQAPDANDHEVISAIDYLLASLPDKLPLGLYECPAPFRLLLSDAVLQHCAESGRFSLLKDVSCDLPTLIRRLALTQGSPLRILNANAAIAWPAFKAGAPGFCGVFNNFHPDLYSWLFRQGSRHEALADELAVFLALAAGLETQGYPACAKHFHVRQGTFTHTHCRVMSDAIESTWWGIGQLLNYVEQGSNHYRQRIAALPQHHL